ncbi:helix-turn-helix domain-containing protein [Agathobaculum sp.]|uniref:helix-turn-helix domain-containing protein n=1 Tax=Agathobaculum sp. TaxID=2048138 RepID=UPI002A7FACA7|nr:helix-turn-helix transcriptional regulator [Agathobaculum sp.]MDY3618460.1 helix-turn-helix transcriptional regulator [Agathobaculum sp.]
MKDTTGGRIKQRRKELGLSAEQLAADIGKGSATVYRYENYDYDRIPNHAIELIAKRLDVSADYLRRFTDDPKETAGDFGNMKINPLQTQCRILNHDAAPRGNAAELEQHYRAQYMKRMRYSKRFSQSFEQLTEDEIENVLSYMEFLASRHK